VSTTDQDPGVGSIPATPYDPRYVHTGAGIHVEAARPVHLTMLVVVGVLCLASIGAGAYAIYKGAVADTSFSFLGARLTTTHVGVALAGIGLIGLVLICRRILKSMEILAALPPDR